MDGRSTATVDDDSNDGVGAPAPASEGLACEWDVHRVASDNETPFTYFFRIRIQNWGDGKAPVRSLARFYALRFAGGRIFPLTRLTEGDDSFSLGFREDYKFC